MASDHSKGRENRAPGAAAAAKQAGAKSGALQLFLSDFKTLRRGENHSFMEIFDTILTDILLLIFGEIEL